LQRSSKQLNNQIVKGLELQLTLKKDEVTMKEMVTVEQLMYHFKTENKEKAENTLLTECKSSGVCQKNVHTVSNVPGTPGYVYVIAS
jgi:hypothetical protein